MQNEHEQAKVPASKKEKHSGISREKLTKNFPSTSSLASNTEYQSEGLSMRSGKPADVTHLKKKLSKVMNALETLDSKEYYKKKKEKENLEYLLNTKEAMIQLAEREIQQAVGELQENLEKRCNEFAGKVERTIHDMRKKQFDQQMGVIQEENSVSRLFSEKVFSHHDSMLTELFRTKEEILTLYHMALASMLLLMVNLLLSDYFRTGEIFDMKTVKWCLLDNVGVVAKAWFVLLIYSYFIIVFVKLIERFNISKKVWIPLYVAYQLLLYAFPCYIGNHEPLNLGSAMILFCETARFSMKTHSYFRNKLLYGFGENPYMRYIPDYARQKGFTEAHLAIPKITIDSFSKEVNKYTYFLNSPTLIYRDEYLRRPKVNIGFVFFNLFNFLFCIYYAFVLFKTFIKDNFENIGKEPGTSSTFVLSFFKSMLPGTFFLFLGFYGLLHSWFNMWAELLRFPDRKFYEDWWNSLEFGSYYRKWNIVVHEWLFYYVYLDIVRFSKSKIGRNTAQLLTFMISAVIHELILTYAIGFFYPILFIIFTGPGIILIKNSRNHKSKQLNILFWMLMYLGIGILIVLYFREYYARHSLIDSKVKEQFGFFHWVVPRSLAQIIM